MKKLVLGMAVACLTTSTLADSEEGFYANVSGGINFLGDQTLDVVIGSGVASSDAGFDASFAGGGAVGYRFANNISVEGEFLYRRAELDSVNLGDIGTFSDGDFANTQINVNAYYHFGLEALPAIEPYIGAGLAYINEVDIDLEDAGGVEREFESDEFGFEIMAGARYAVFDRGFVDVGVRYMPIGGVDLERSNGSADSISSDYDPFMLTAKFGWRF